MSEEINDANTGEENAAGADSSPDAVELEPIMGDDGLVSTMEYQAVEKEESAETDTDGEDTPDDAGQNTSTDQEPDKTDFHEHPRFKELIEEKNSLKQEIEDLKAKIEKPADQPKETPAEQTNFRNIMEMKDEDIVDEITTSPKSFLANFAMQVAHEIRADIQASEATKQAEAKALSQQEREQKTVTDFFADKEDGRAMVDDGRIKAFIKENPGHNEISAYHALAGESIQKAAIESAVKQAEERIYKELKAKGKAKSTATPTGGTLLNSGKSPEMKNPDKFGGVENVLLKRHLARQKAS